MNIYLISQEENNDYDTFDSAVVVAPDEETARGMSPSHGMILTPEEWSYKYSSWASKPENVSVKFIGTTDEKQGVICASFNAG